MQRIIATIVAAGVAVSLTACAGSPFETRLSMGKSRNAYKTCLAQKGVDGCAAEREMYNADREAAGLSPLPQPRATVVVQ